MELRVLGCAGAEFPGVRTTAFLVDETILLDGGTIGAALNEEEQRRIRHILVTHAHLDHIKGIPLLADNLLLRGDFAPVVIYGLPYTLDALRNHLMNNIIWPDFSRLPSPESPVIIYCPVESGMKFSIESYQITPWLMQHSVPSVGYRIENGAENLFFTGDTGPTQGLLTNAGPLSVLITEASFPDEMEELARLTGHLTPRLLAQELALLPQMPEKILISHMKPQYREEISRQLTTLGPAIRIICDNELYRI